VADLSQTIVTLTQALAAAQQALVPASLLGQVRQQPVIAAGPALSLDPPVFLSPVSRRARTVTDIISATEGSTWLAIQGAASTGKTILVRLVAERLGGRVCWIDFTDLDDEGGAERLEQACAILAGCEPPTRREGWYRSACAALGERAVLVFARLPDLAVAPQLLSRIAPLVKECERSGVRVLSSSLSPLPLGARTELGGSVVEVPAAPLRDEEAGEVLAAYGAPAPIATEHAGLVNQLAKRHPFLLVAACQYLQRRNWALGQDEVLELLGGAHTADFGVELYRKLQSTVSDADSRELLYRLTVAGRQFLREQLEALAAVPQPIRRAAERLPELMNSWVERVEEGKWVVSPLSERLAADYLDGATKRRCHDSLGELVVRRGLMNQRDAYEAVVHFREAGEWGKAGSILMLILHEAWRVRADLRGEQILTLWVGVPLPVEMDLNLRLVIRGLQVALFHRMGRPLGFLVSDLDSLLAQADGRHRLGVAGAASYSVVEVARALPRESNRWIRRLLQVSADRRGDGGGRRGRREKRAAPDLSPGFPLHLLVRLLIGGLETAEHVHDWLDTVSLLPGEQRRIAFQGPDARVACIVVGDQLGATELAKPKEQRNWPAVVTALDGLATRAKELSLEGLWAAFIRAKIIAQAEFSKDVDGAQATATAALSAALSDPGARFLICGAMGRQHVLARRYGDARFWLQLALQKDASSVFQHERMLVVLAASHVFGLKKPSDGVEYARQAVAVAEANRFIPAIERARAFAELAVAEFEASGAQAAFASWDRAAEYLFAARGGGDDWKDLAVIFGHAGQYLWRMAETGEPPKVTRDGDPYAPPARGMFMTSNPARVGFFNARSEGSLWRLVAAYADAVGAGERASVWKTRAVAVATEQGFTPLLVEAARDAVPLMLRKKRFAQAIAEARKAGAALVVYMREKDAGRDPMRADLDVVDAAGRLSAEDRRTAEDFGAVMGLVPAVLSVATLAIKDGTREQARQKASEIAAACRAVAPGSCAPDLWATLADAVERAYVHGDDNEEILRWRQTLPQPFPSSLAAVSLVAAAAQATPQQAIASLLPAMPELCKLYPPSSSVYREILLPFVDAYWTDAFENRRFQFGNAVVVEHLLPGAKATPEPERASAIFRAVHTGFKFRERLPEAIRHWLFGSQ
jgi:hypothetical protein